MQTYSKVAPKRYRLALREQMESPFAFGQTRFTGLVLGNFFYITHHAGYEWNRRITNEKSRAIGYIKQHGDGSLVKAVCLRGYTDPFSLLCMFLFCALFFFLRGADPFREPIFLWTSIAITLVCALGSAASCWLTQRGQESMFELLILLENPVPFWKEQQDG